jgi:hypothetical protein
MERNNKQESIIRENKIFTIRDEAEYIVHSRRIYMHLENEKKLPMILPPKQIP